MGRSLKKIDPAKVMAMAVRNCSVTEIAAECGCSHDTLERRFRKELEAGWEKHKAALRSALFEEGVIKRKERCLIYLHERAFPETKKIELSGSDDKPILIKKVNYDSLSEDDLEQLEKIAKKLRDSGT